MLLELLLSKLVFPPQGPFAAHLHVAVLVPELVHARKQRNSTVPYVTGVVGKLAPHLELGVAEPDRLVKKWNVKRARSISGCCRLHGNRFLAGTL